MREADSVALDKGAGRFPAAQWHQRIPHRERCMMLWSLILATSFAGLDKTPPVPTVSVTVDSSRHELTITSGPFDLPNMPPMEDHAMMDLGMSHDTRLQRFEWPVTGWFRGFRVELIDRQGRAVPAHVMHHMIMVNFSRRQLLYSAAERLMGTGTETGEVSVPKTIGVPMKPGMNLGMYIAWHNDTGQDLEGVQLKLIMLWTPKNQNPQPVNALPIYMDVNLTVGGHREIKQGLRVHSPDRRPTPGRRGAHARLRQWGAAGGRRDRQSVDPGKGRA
jgi:hypothetical protein